jgi:hypothetical protein
MITDGHRPARDIIEALFAQLPNPDANFISDFQTGGFDARIWELYLFALALECGWNPTRPVHTPDYHLQKGEQKVWLEAVTANPTQGRETVNTDAFDLDALEHYAANILPIKLGSALTSKLSRRYWELPHVAGHPLVIAIADFHDTSSFRWNEHALSCYLYGLKPRQTSAPGEIVTAVFETIEEHRDGAKTIPSGFFSLPGAENVSAVIFSDAGTIAKFNRLGYDAVRYPDVSMIRWGFASDPDPRAFMPTPFGYIVGDVPETWRDGVSVFHNPNALHHIDHSFFDGLTQHWLAGTQLKSDVPEFHPFISQTTILQSSDGRSLGENARAALTSMLEQLIEGMHKQVGA